MAKESFPRDEIGSTVWQFRYNRIDIWRLVNYLRRVVPCCVLDGLFREAVECHERARRSP
jgi:hypothetical protein